MRSTRCARAAIAASLSAASLCATLLAAGRANAQYGIGETNWRQSSRPAPEKTGSSQNFAFELRFGPYRPDVDSAFTDAQPYKQAFGDSAQFYFGLELDWQAVRIPWVGVLGPGFGWGFTRTSTKAKIEGTSTASGEDTSLTILPMHLSAVLRGDELMRRTGIPIVPYAKLGIGLATWSAGNSSGTARYDGVLGRDTTWGYHFALGAMLALNWIDRRGAVSMDESVGVNHAYLFGEYMDAHLDGIGSRPQMRVGSRTWVVGFAMDM